MSLLASLATDDTIENEKDSAGSMLFDSDCYPMTVSTAFIQKSDGGALGLNVTFKAEDGRQLKQMFWMTSGTAKGCKNYYEKDGEKKYLPGFLQANALALLTVGREIASLDTEVKVVKQWNRDAKAEIPTKVDMLMDLLEQPVIVGVVKQTVDKTEKSADGTYVPTGETRDENEVDKLFRAKDKKTTAEIRAEADEAEFINKWISKWKGQVKNKAKGAQGTAGVPKTKSSAAATKKPSTSLFG
jgi:hypothetical protein